MKRLKYKRNGITLVEMIIASALLSIISALITSFLLDMQRSFSLQTAYNLLKTRDIKAINDIGKKINSSVSFITRDPVIPITDQYKMNYFMSKINLPTSTIIDGVTYTPLDIKSRILPELNQNMSFSPLYINDTSSMKFKPDAVGNTLFIACSEDSLNYKYTDNVLSKEIIKSIDLYQFHYYYLAKSNSKLTNGDNNKNSIFLFHWESQYYADYDEIMSISTIANSPGLSTSNFFSYLANSNTRASNNKNIKIVGAWNTKANALCATTSGNNYIYNITSTGLTNSSCSLTSKDIQMYKNDFYSINNAYQGDKIFSVTRNNETLESSSNRKVPVYANISSTLNQAPDYYPHGFEVMINGQSGARKVLLRLLSKVSNIKGQSLNNETTIVFQGKDF